MSVGKYFFFSYRIFRGTGFLKNSEAVGRGIIRRSEAEADNTPSEFFKNRAPEKDTEFCPFFAFF